MKYIFIILIASIFYAQGQSKIVVDRNTPDADSIDIFFYSTAHGTVEIQLRDYFGKMYLVKGEKDSGECFKASFDRRKMKASNYNLYVFVEGKLIKQKEILILKPKVK